jgi:hypothetical protein
MLAHQRQKSLNLPGAGSVYFTVGARPKLLGPIMASDPIAAANFTPIKREPDRKFPGRRADAMTTKLPPTDMQHRFVEGESRLLVPSSYDADTRTVDAVLSKGLARQAILRYRNVAHFAGKRGLVAAPQRRHSAS